MISESPTMFASLPVADFTPDSAGLPSADAVAWRLALDVRAEEPFERLWQQFLDTVPADQVHAVVIGPWWLGDYETVEPVIDLLCASAARLPALRGVFLGDVLSEESELSWLEMCDVTPVLEAFPLLEEFTVRGCGMGLQGDGLSFRPVRHERLRVLRFESGGLPGEIVRNVGASELPRLEHLALWLGMDEYGGDAAVADLAPILAGGLFPELTHLGLQDSELQDEIAAAVASAPVVAQLGSLDMSMGTLTDAGAEALLAGQPLTHLRALDLHHHYLSDAMADRLRQALAPNGVEVDLSERQKTVTHDWDADQRERRYVAVSE
jgi:hypothetical protein